MAGPLRRVPSRSCVACRTVRFKRELMRVVRQPDGTVTIDTTGRLAGRGAYVCRDAGCLDRAIAKGALVRALRSQLPADVRAQLAMSAHQDEGTQTNNNDMTEGGARGQE